MSVLGRLSQKYRKLFPQAVDGRVATRFAPEPGGFLHIGHVKAALVSRHLADVFAGKMRVRFDDTNPRKEREEFVEAILGDLRLVGVSWDELSFTSDHFDTLLQLCVRGIQEGFLYCDDTPEEQMKAERSLGIGSARRDSLVEDNLHLFEELCKGRKPNFCVRAKIDFKNANKCLRDPVVYRPISQEHGRTGNRFRIYPTYDFACPLVDSLEGITHAARSSEYADRMAQYSWFLESFGFPKIEMLEFSKLNFVATTLSKRQIARLIEAGLIPSWEDPRLPTIRGLLRRGLSPQALTEFVLDQGPSKNSNLMEWDKLWSLNRQHREPACPRVAAVSEHSCLAQIKNVPLGLVSLMKMTSDSPETPSHFRPQIRIENTDLSPLTPGDQVVLVGLGAFKFEGTDPTPTFVFLPHQTVFSKLPKISWVPSDPSLTCPLLLDEFGPLLSAKKLPENADVADYFNRASHLRSNFVCDARVLSFETGRVFQILRRGLCIIDRKDRNGTVRAILVPDGRARPMGGVLSTAGPPNSNNGIRLDR